MAVNVPAIMYLLPGLFQEVIYSKWFSIQFFISTVYNAISSSSAFEYRYLSIGTVGTYCYIPTVPIARAKTAKFYPPH